MSDDIEEILNEIDQSENNNLTQEELEDTIEVVEKDLPSNTPDATEDEELMQSVVDMTLDDRKKANDLYDVFLPEVSQGRDRSSASKEAMSKAVELKIAAAKNIIDLLKIKRDVGNKTGIFIGNSISGKKAGIDLNKIKNNI